MEEQSSAHQQVIVLLRYDTKVETRVVANSVEDLLRIRRIMSMSPLIIEPVRQVEETETVLQQESYDLHAQECVASEQGPRNPYVDVEQGLSTDDVQSSLPPISESEEEEVGPHSGSTSKSSGAVIRMILALAIVTIAALAVAVGVYLWFCHPCGCCSDKDGRGGTTTTTTPALSSCTAEVTTRTVTRTPYGAHVHTHRDIHVWDAPDIIYTD